VTSQFPTLVSHRSSAFLRVIRLTVLVTQFTAILHAGSRVSCHNFLSLCLCLSRRSGPSRSLFSSENVAFLVDSLYAEAIEAVKSRASLWASTLELIWILGDTKSEPRLLNQSRSVSFSVGPYRFLVLT
jgi:hypothetical protein